MNNNSTNSNSDTNTATLHGRIDYFEEEYIAARAFACVCTITYYRNCIIDTIKSRTKHKSFIQLLEIDRGMKSWL